ncbi:MAG TPA: hypothetical protein VEK34_14575 [Methylocella sp.]|nr:hypothetical protein [Methylocella sp.]
MTLHKIISWLYVAVALSAAGLWFYASIIQVPTDIQSGYGSLVGVEEMSAGFKKQGFWNAAAAAMTGVAVLLELVAAKAFPPE